MPTRSTLTIAALGCVAFMLLPAAVIGVVVLTAAGGVEALCGGDGGFGGGTQTIGDHTWDPEQLGIVRTITTRTLNRALPRRAAVLATATGIVESDLHNIAHGDRDSLGVYQQRPSTGWGSPEQILNPSYATNTFLTHLIAVSGWDTLPPGMAEQAVQASAFPDRYTSREPDATALVAKFWTGPDNPPPPAPGTTPVMASAGGCPDHSGSTLPATSVPLPPGYQLPADPARRDAVAYALTHIGKPYVWGAKGPDAFDCSGLTQAAWAHAGVALSAGTAGQLHNGDPVPTLLDAQPGDLLFIPGDGGSAANPQHVGLDVGDGLVVDAYDTRHGVILEPRDTWAAEVVAIRHITPDVRSPQ